MKKITSFIVALFIFNLPALKAQSDVTTLDIIGWNIEFFGAPFNSGPPDKDLQESNVKKLMRYFDADVYGLVEIVDTTRLRRLRDSLGTNYDFVISPTSSNGSIGGNGWRQAQKLAVMYKKNIFTNVSSRAMLSGSPTAVSNWASGRVPFLFRADATIGSITKTVNIIVVHGKAGSTADDYNRRLAGVQELKDTLDAHFSTANTFIIGDYNDALNQTISTGSGPQSSYQPLIVDSTDADHYKSITLSLANAGQTSMINFPNVVDNHVISNEVVPFYVLNSAKIRTDVTVVVPDFVSAHNTSDHYPIFSQYSLAGIVTSVPTIPVNETGIKVFPNPYTTDLTLQSMKTLNNVKINLVNMEGQLVDQRAYAVIVAGSNVRPQFKPTSKGVYFLQVETKDFKTVIKLVHL